MSENGIIRLVTPADYDSIRDIYAYYVRNTVITFDYDVPTPEEWKAKIENIILKYPFLVCEYKKQLVGYAYASDFRHKLAYQWSPEATIYVKNGFHGKKIGKKLYTTLLGLLKQQGFRTVYGVITIPNDVSIQLHTSLGFIPVATFEKIGYKSGAWHDTHWLQLVLNTHTSDPQPPKEPVKELAEVFSL